MLPLKNALPGHRPESSFAPGLPDDKDARREDKSYTITMPVPPGAEDLPRPARKRRQRGAGPYWRGNKSRYLLAGKNGVAAHILGAILGTAFFAVRENAR